MKRLATILTLLLLLPASVFAATAGPRNCTTGADVGRGGTAWTSPGNGCTSGASTTASSIPASGGYTDWLVATNFSFAIPPGATISGIQVSFNRSGSTINSIQDSAIYLTKNGTATIGTNHNSATFWPTTSTAASYGSTGDLWGTTWTPSDINASTFGVMVSASNQNASLSKSATVYGWVTITITYTVASGRSFIPGIIGQSRPLLKTQTRETSSDWGIDNVRFAESLPAWRKR